MDLQHLLRGDSVSQSDALGKQVTAGIRKPNEAREILDLDPVPEGNVLMIQGAMVSMENAQKAPENKTPAPPDPSQQEPAPTQQKPTPKQQQYAAKFPEQKAAPFAKLLQECYARFLRVDEDKARRAIGRGKLAEHVAGYYTEKNQDERGEMISPILSGFLLAAGGDPRFASLFAFKFAGWFNEHSREDLLREGAIPTNWGEYAAENIDRQLREIWRACVQLHGSD